MPYKPDLLIIDSTGALKQETRPNKEAKVCQNILELTSGHIRKNPRAKAYVALFSTQVERVQALSKGIKSITGLAPKIVGMSLVQNLKAFDSSIVSDLRSPVSFCTGVWAQGAGNVFDSSSALVRLANGTDKFDMIESGDLVILSGSIPTWSPTLSFQIQGMCEKLVGRGARVIVDTSAPMDWLFTERKEVHSGGHGHFPEIQSVIDRTSPKQVFPFHASQRARDEVAKYCKGKGIDVAYANQSQTITF